VHHVDCKRSKFKLSVNGGDRRAKPCMLTHYKETFTNATYDARPAQSYRPPPDVNNLTPFLSQWTPDFSTVMHSSYQPFEKTPERTQPVKLVDKYETSSEPMNGVSETRAEFQPLKSERVVLVKGQPMIKIPTDKFASNTTTNDFFKDWKADKPEKGHYNYPSFAGEVIFPSNTREFSTSISSTYQPKPIVKVQSVNKSGHHGTLKPEGEMDMDTNYKSNFVLFKDFVRTKSIIPDKHSKKVMSLSARAHMTGVTQNKVDFKSYPNHRPPPPTSFNPFESYLNFQLYPGNKYAWQNYFI
jgi:hypothetical protein